jgi:AraC family transcriptional regulator, ethanolamine operon transcriptional activator
VCTFAVDDELLERAGQTLGLAVPWRELSRTEVFDFEPAPMAALRGMLARICAQLTQPLPGPVGAAIYSELERETPKLLVRGLTSAGPVDARTTSPARAAALQRARAYMIEHAADAVTIRDICRKAGVCERMLEYTFREHYGVTPKAYLQAFRLNGVRRELHAAAPADMKVADAANRWGFWHMGQFAADYRKLFGEKPSETLGRVVFGSRTQVREP